MRAGIRLIVCTFAAFFTIAAIAQIKTPSEYVIGELPNGLSYYLVKNTLESGRADIALIQRQPGDTRGSLDRLSSLGKRIPWKFFSERGVAPSPDGYVSYEAGAAVYDFHDIPVGEAFDSTLFVITGLSSTSPCRQALAICGDIDVDAVKKALELLSLSVSVREELPPAEEYIWEPGKKRAVSFEKAVVNKAAVITYGVYSPRLSEEELKTMRPFIARYYSGCLREVLALRLQKAFQESGVAFGGFSLDYLSSGSQDGDVKHSLRLTTSARDLQRACDCFGRVMAELAEYGVSDEEYEYVRHSLNVSQKEKNEFVKMSNSQYVESCVHSYLYGMSLVSVSAVQNFFSSRVIDISKENHFFNMYIKAFFGPDHNEEIVFSAVSDPGAENMAEVFDRARSSSVVCPAVLDTAMYGRFKSLMSPLNNPVKLKSTRTVAQLNGSFLTFSNGMRVAFKQSGDDKTVDFSLMLSGGVLQNGDFSEGESAFVQDIFKLCNIGGIPYRQFSRFLLQEGITLNFRAGYSNLVFYGSVPDTKVQLLVPLFTALQQLTPPGRSTVENYLHGIEVQEQLPEFRLNSRIDSLLRPTEKNHQYKFTRNFKTDTAEKTVELIKSHLAKTGDAVLVLIGDISQDNLKKQLSRYLGVFSASPKKYTAVARPDISRIATGTALITGSELAPNSLRIKIMRAHVMNRENFITFKLASMCLHGAVAEVAAAKGFSVKETDKWATYPEDHFTLQLDLTPCLSEGLPASIASAASAYDVLADLHTGLKDVADKYVSRLPDFKKLLSSRFSAEQVNEHIKTNYLLIKYSEGRDMVSDQGKILESIKEEDVRNAIDELLAAGRVEYISQ